VPHLGGIRFRSDSLECRTLFRGIAEGAGSDLDTVSALEGLTVTPPRRVL
jgi:hypothetical protein